MSLEAAAARLEALAQERCAVPGLSVALIAPGWQHAFAQGVACVASGAPMRVESLLPIASIGKAMTAVALLREAEAGRCGLDDPVHDWLPWLPLRTPHGPIRLRHLLGHTAGIVNGSDGSPAPVVEALALADTEVAPPGSRFAYSNVGYALLGLVLERVAGCSYQAAIERHVLEPCGLRASTAVTSAAAQTLAATGHLALADGTLVPAPWVPTAHGAGSTLCSGPDLGRFLRALVADEPPLLAPALREAMLTPGLGGYGLGVWLDDDDDAPRVGHSGHCPGFASHAYGCRATGVGVAVLWNGPGSAWLLVEHGLALLRAAVRGQPLPRPPEPVEPLAAAPRQPAALPPELAPLVGRYASYNPWEPGVEVVGEGAGLALLWPGGTRRALRALSGGEFALADEPGSPERIRFGSVVEGRPWQLWLSGWSLDRVG